MEGAALQVVTVLGAVVAPHTARLFDFFRFFLADGFFSEVNLRSCALPRAQLRTVRQQHPIPLYLRGLSPPQGV